MLALSVVVLVLDFSYVWACVYITLFLGVVVFCVGMLSPKSNPTWTCIVSANVEKIENEKFSLYKFYLGLPSDNCL